MVRLREGKGVADDDTQSHVRQRRRLGADMMQKTFILVVALLGAAVVA